MKKYAQVKQGKIIYFYQTDLPIEELSSVFSPKTFWVDVTDKECALGWEVTFNQDCEMVLTAPVKVVPAVPTEAEIKEQTKQHLLQAVDAYMDKTVQDRGYDNIAKCVTYEGDIDPIFNAEGTAAKQWRSKVYRRCYEILAEVEAGIRPVPTKDELIAELPILDW